MVVHAFTPGTWEAEFKTSLDDGVNSRLVRLTQRVKGSPRPDHGKQVT